MAIRGAWAALIGLLWAASAAAQAPEPARLTFLHFNDAYQISPRRGLGGFGPLATLVKRERERAPGAIVTFGGDLISPSLLSGLTKGRHMIELMNALKVDAAVLGNHEFDHGPEVLKQRIAESKFAWLGANVLDAEGKPFGGAAATWMTKVGSITVGAIGLVTPGALNYIRGSTPVRFVDFVPVARQAAVELKAKGAAVIVAITHMSVAEDQALARAVPEINLILGGHEHIPITIYERGTLILKAGTDAEFLGVVDLDIERAGGRLTIVPSWRLVPVHRIEADPEVQAIVRRYEGELTREFGQPAGKTETPLDSRAAVVRFRESAIGNLIADAMREAMGADAALMNGGGIRGNKLYPPGATITRRDVLSELPFNNAVVLLEASGAAIKAALEHGLSRHGSEFGGFPHVSGIRAEFDPTRPAGRRVIALSIGGAPADPAKIYLLATNDFLSEGGDGYAVLRDLKRRVDAAGGPGITNAVIDYLAKRGAVAPREEGRLVEKK
jgi:2',3'-cyclic-nucleotide 2'-phosphodiesterase (5'-nucleotidase family)